MSFRSIATAIGIAALALLTGTRTCTAAPGFYSVTQLDGVWWFIDPQDKPFYSVGVCDIGPGPSRETYNVNRPAYAAFQNYASTDAWADDTLRRLAEWKFNTIGGWAHESLTRGPIPYAVVLHLGAELGVPWNDIFSNDFEATVEKLVRDRVGPHSDDKNLIGWFTDNEQGWYPETLFDFHVSQPVQSSTRSALIEMLRDQYQDDFNSLKRDFAVHEAASFDELASGGTLERLRDGDGRKVVLRFTGAIAKRYYQVTHAAIRRHDPNHLILGDRYAWHCPEVVAKAAAPYVDVISTNLDWPEAADGFLPAGYLRSLHQITGRPVLVTEYYVAARENRSGNKNSGGTFLTVDTQKERTAAFENRLRGLAEQPYVVGAHWFRFADEPTHGRASDGEDYNFGVVDIHNRPYNGLVAAMTRLHADVPRLHRESRIADRPQTDPILIPRMHAAVSELHKQLFAARSLGAVDESLELYELLATWNPEALHLVALVSHISERTAKPGSSAHTAHELELTIESHQLKVPVRVQFGGLPGTAASGAEVKCSLTSKGLRQTLVIAVPPKLLGAARFEAGQQFDFNLTLNNLLDQRTTNCERRLVLAGDGARNGQSANETRRSGNTTDLPESAAQ